MTAAISPVLSSVIFYCNICGMRAPEPILCVRNRCPTDILIHGVASVRKH